jgi:endonuclease/exonuclease/phosphatase family metal-dependent hydrolase
VVLLQEASLTPGRHGNAAERLRDMLNRRLADRGVTYNSVFHMANGSGLAGFFEGSAILSRWRILSADVLAYDRQALIPPEHRIALRARIEMAPPGESPGGRSLDVVSTHLTNTRARCRGALVRTLQARELVRWLETGAAAAPAALVVGGDFNDVPGSDTIRALTEAGLGDAWAEAGQGAAGLTSLAGPIRDSSARAMQRIDYLFVRSVAVEGAQPFLDSPGRGADGGALWASDHSGVAAAIRLPASPSAAGTPRR